MNLFSIMIMNLSIVGLAAYVFTLSNSWWSIGILLFLFKYREGE